MNTDERLSICVYLRLCTADVYLNETLALPAEVIQQPNGMAMVVALLRYLGRAGIQLDKNEVASKLAELLPKEGEILMQTLINKTIFSTNSKRPRMRCIRGLLLLVEQ